MRPSLFVEFAKTFQTPQQWTLNSLLLRLQPATPPQLIHIRVQKNRGDLSRFDQLGVAFLHKRSTPQGNHSLSAGPHTL
jgi:hypothetical protein